jgi:hypothetical protein
MRVSSSSAAIDGRVPFEWPIAANSASVACAA